MLITAEVAPASTVRVVSPLVICPGLLLDMKFAEIFLWYWSSLIKILTSSGSRTVSDVTENDRSTSALSIWCLAILSSILGLIFWQVEFEVSTIYPFAWSHSVQIW